MTETTNPNLEEALKYVKMAIGQISRIVGPNDVEDVLQNTRLHVWQHLDQFKGDSKLSSWVYSVAINEALIARRKSRAMSRDVRKTKMFSELERTNSRGELVKFDIGDTTIPNMDSIIDVERRIKELAKGYGDVILKFEILGYSQEEISAQIRTSIGSIKSQHFKGMQKLRERFSVIPVPPERIIRLYKMGMSYTKIGKRCGITRQRVHQIIKEHRYATLATGKS
jgi:RNA polymerase sigma-70 factor (ECF subfamily)